MGEPSRPAEMTAFESPPTLVSAEALEECGPILLAAARLITLNNDEARDLVQTTFEIALRRSSDLRDPAALRAWLLRIETREAFRLVRRLRRLVSFKPALHDVADASSDPSGSVVGRVDLRTALAGLPVRIRAAVVLHHMADLSVADTAAALGVSENTVKTQLRMGLAKLWETLRDE